MALGAGRRDVLRLVVLQGIKLAIAGVVVGVVGSFFITPIIGSMLVTGRPEGLRYGSHNAGLREAVLKARAATKPCATTAVAQGFSPARQR